MSKHVKENVWLSLPLFLAVSITTKDVWAPRQHDPSEYGCEHHNKPRQLWVSVIDACPNPSPSPRVGVFSHHNNKGQDSNKNKMKCILGFPTNRNITLFRLPETREASKYRRGRRLLKGLGVLAWLLEPRVLTPTLHGTTKHPRVCPKHNKTDACMYFSTHCTLFPSFEETTNLC